MAVSKNLQDLHQRLASSLMVSKSDSAMSYTVNGVEQHTAEVLTLLKRKEERLQIEVNKCAELRTENLMLTKQLQVRAAQLLPECCLVLDHCGSATASSRTPAAFQLALHVC